MSVYWMSWVWQDGPDDPTDRYVLLKLADNADQDGNCFPSLPEICERTRLAESTVRRAIARLESSGLLSVSRGRGAGKKSQYRLHKKVSERNLSERNLSQRNLSQRPEKGVTETEKGVTETNPPHPLIGVTVINRQEPSEASENFEDDPSVAARMLSEMCGNFNMKFQADRTLQIKAEAKKRGMTCKAVAELMISQWEKYNASRSKLNYPVSSAERFWASGIWHDESLWPWKSEHRPQTKRRYALMEGQ